MQQKLFDALERHKNRKKSISTPQLANIFHNSIIDGIGFGDKKFTPLNNENSLIFYADLNFSKTITNSYNIYHKDNDIFLYDYENNGKYLSAISMYILESKENNDLFIIFTEMYLEKVVLDITDKNVYEVTDILISASHYDVNSKQDCKSQYFKYNTFAIARIELISNYSHSNAKKSIKRIS